MSKECFAVVLLHLIEMTDNFVDEIFIGITRLQVLADRFFFVCTDKLQLCQIEAELCTAFLFQQFGFRGSDGVDECGCLLVVFAEERQVCQVESPKVFVAHFGVIHHCFDNLLSAFILCKYFSGRLHE